MTAGRRPRWVWRPPGSRFWYIEFVWRKVTYRFPTGTANLKEAKRIAARRRREITEQQCGETYRGGGGITFAAASIEYFRTMGYRTTNADALWLGLQLAEEIVKPQTPLAAMDDMAMVRFRKAYENLPTQRTREPGKRSNSTINDFTRLIHRVLNFACNYMHVVLPHMPNPKKYLLSEVWRMRELSSREESALDRMERRELVPLWKFIIETGLRREAACTLTWHQVDEALKTITIVEKGSKRQHVVPLSDEALRLLGKLKGQHPEYVFTIMVRKACVARGRQYQAGERIPIEPNYFASLMRKAFKKAEIRNFTVHDFRHTAATRLLRACGNLEIVRKFLGHTTLKQTQRYVHMVEEDVVAGIEMLNIARRSANRDAVASLELLKAGNGTPTFQHVLYALALRAQMGARLYAAARLAA